MTSDRDFAQAIEEIHRRWGSRSIGRLGDHQRPTTQLSTGYPDLDQLLRGGLPHGRLTQLLGRPTSGMRK